MAETVYRHPPLFLVGVAGQPVAGPYPADEARERALAVPDGHVIVAYLDGNTVRAMHDGRVLGEAA